MKAFGKTLVLAVVCMVFVFAGSAKASLLELGTANFGIHVYEKKINFWGGEYMEYQEVGAGSFEGSYLDGAMLDFLYCVDFYKTIQSGESYKDTTYNNAGQIYGKNLNNAGQVAWLLDTYAYNIDGHGDAATALQAAIWYTVHDGKVGLDTRDPYGKRTNEITLYNGYIEALGSNDGDLSKYAWITPGINTKWGTTTIYQGLVGGSNPVPVPAAAWLLGAGLVGLVGIRRKVRG
ncbi:MAG: VPLPA-CTERM sorting domain-containing protein [bacterium]|nr:VPLPA-CTERM sorting domain-containing protein [bacterium]